MTYKDGNKTDKKHYWLTPPELKEKVIEELGPEFFDPAPFPKPENYNGLESEWGDKNYVNPRDLEETVEQVREQYRQTSLLG